MGRELRKVPAGWEHPKNKDGHWQPLHSEFYGDALNEWFENSKQWEAGTHPYFLKYELTKEEYPFYAMYAGNPPDVEYYQVKKYSEEELTHIQLYETTSEGTPLSPVFPKDQFEQLCEWAAENTTTFADFTATKEQWMKMLTNGLVYHEQGNFTWI